MLALTACTASTPEKESMGAGFITVNESDWYGKNYTSYPFTTSGEISCGIGPFGREVYFEPEGFTDESYIGTPLNKTAVSALKRNDVTPNVPYSIRKDADLHEVIEVGLRVCDEQRD